MAIFDLLFSWKKSSHSNNYFSLTIRDFEPPISVKQVQTWRSCPQRLFFEFLPKYNKCKFLFSLFNVLTPLWPSLYIVTKKTFSQNLHTVYVHRYIVLFNLTYMLYSLFVMFWLFFRLVQQLIKAQLLSRRFVSYTTCMYHTCSIIPYMYHTLHILHKSHTLHVCTTCIVLPLLTAKLYEVLWQHVQFKLVHWQFQKYSMLYS